ncbi:MAG TPA: TonB-dependent receptor [Bacteroidales bacterium]|nr:TonB-dependent receptor [Bacteroidales bacterium]
MRKFLLFLIAVFFLHLGINAQTVLLSGKVIDKSNKEALYGVNIIIDNVNGLNPTKSQLGTTTDFDGVYKVALYPGTYKVKFVYIGYEEIEEQVDLIVGKPVVIDIMLEQKAEIIEEVVVSAGKYEQKLSEVTVSMEVIKPSTIENTNSYDISEAINQVPGVDISDKQPSIRSSTGWSYGAGSRVIILMDDLPIMSADAADVKWNYIPIENISQVEVVKGASSAMFGSSALGGVINVRSAYPTDKPVTKVSYFDGVYGNPKDDSYNWWGKEFFTGTNSKFNVLLRDEVFYFVRQPMYSGISFSHSQKFDNLDVSLGGNHFIDEGFREFEYEKRSRFNANIRYRSKKIQGLAVGLNSNFMAIDMSDFFMWKSDTTPYLANTSFGAVIPTEGYRMNIDPFIYYYKPNGSRYSIRTRYFRTENVMPTDTAKNSIGNTFYAEYQYQTVWAEKWNFTAGFVNSYSTVEANLFGNHKSNNFSGYSQVDAKFGRLNASVGIRGEYFVLDSTQTESAFDINIGESRIEIPIRPVFRTGLNYSITDQTFLRASFGQGYRFPSIAEKYTAAALGMVNILPNPRLLPESGWSAEIGVKQGFKLGKWRGFADLALYRQNIDKMMEFTFGVFNALTYELWQDTDTVPPTLGFQSQNIGDVKINGIDASATITGKVRNCLITSIIGYSYNNPMFREMVDTTTSSLLPTLKYRNKHTIKGDVNFETKRLTFGINVIWRSKMDNVDRLFCDERPEETVNPVTYNSYKLFSSFILPGYWDYRLNNADEQYFNIDLRCGFKFSESLRASFIVKNVFNQVYVGRPGDMHAPRRFEVVLSADF